MSGELTTDVAVVGAGPAGGVGGGDARPLRLPGPARRPGEVPRDKCCGDGLTTGALRRLQALGLDPGAVPSFTPVADLTLRSPSGRIARLPLGTGPETHAAVARRADLDAALGRPGTRRRRSTVLEGHAFEELREDAGSGQLVVQLAEGGTVRASYLIGADGAWSPVRRAVDHPPEAPDRDEGARGGRGQQGAGRRPRRRTSGQGDWHAFRAYANGVGPEAAEHLLGLVRPDDAPRLRLVLPPDGGGA